MTFDAYWSDPHFGHANVLAYSSRPFANTDEMRETLVANFNAIVPANGRTLWLGDCFFCSDDEAREIMQRLHGAKVLVLGNHDRAPARMASLGFEFVTEQASLSIAGRRVLASHYPHAGTDSREDARSASVLSRYPIKAKGRVLLHGHVHERWRRKGTQVHVGVDAWDYRPATHDEIAALVAEALP